MSEQTQTTTTTPGTAATRLAGPLGQGEAR
jgi:hypothetical protein